MGLNKHQNNGLDNVLLCDDFSINDVDKCVYTNSENGECALYVYMWMTCLFLVHVLI